VHRSLGQQRQDGCPHVTAPSTARAATTASAASATSETGAETGAEAAPETGAKAGAETERPVRPAGVLAELFDEFLSRLVPGAVQRTSLCVTGCKAESQAWPSGEWLARRSELVVHVCSPYVS